jgi:hypothetical protein
VFVQATDGDGEDGARHRRLEGGRHPGPVARQRGLRHPAADGHRERQRTDRARDDGAHRLL